MNSTPKGVMHAGYHESRRVHPVLQYRYKTRAAVVAEAILRHSGPRTPLRVLDLGSADGKTMHELSRRLTPGSQFVGVEYSSDFAASAAQAGHGMRIEQGDIARLPDSVKGHPYDVVTAMAVLEHLERPVEAMKEAAGVLRPGGLLVVTCPDPVWDRMATGLHLLEDHHESFLSRSGLLSNVTQAGFEVLEYRRFMWAPIGFAPYLRIPTSPRFSMRVDELVRRVRVLDWLFVNQLLVARKT